MKTKVVVSLIVIAVLAAGAGMVQAAPAEANRPGPIVSGEVIAIDGAVLTVQRGEQPAVEVLTDAQTRFHTRDNSAVTLADIDVGDHIGVRGQWQDGQLLARDVLLLPDRLGGRVVAINGSTIELVKLDGSAANVATNADTQFRSPDHPNATLADVQVGDAVEAVGDLTGDTLTAAQVVFRTPRAQTGPLALGVIDAVNGSTLTLDTGFGATLTVNAGSAYVVRRGENGAEEIDLSDLAEGDRVLVIGPRSADGGSIEARAIITGQSGAGRNRQPLPPQNRAPAVPAPTL